MRRRRADHKPLTRGERRAVLALFLAFLPYLLMFTAVYQAYNILPVWVDSHVDRQAGGLTIPVTWMYTFDGIATMLGIAVTIRFWRLLQAKQREPDSLAKMAIGSAMTCGAFLILTATSALSSEMIALPWLLAFFILLDFSFIWGEPPLRALVSRRAPPARR